MTTNEIASHVLRLDRVYCSLLVRIAGSGGPTVVMALDEVKELALEVARSRRVYRELYDLRTTEKRK